MSDSEQMSPQMKYYYRNRDKIDLRQKQQREIQKEYFRNYYQDHKEEYIERCNKRKEAYNKKLKDYMHNYYLKHKEYYQAKFYHRNRNIDYKISVQEFYNQLNEALEKDKKRFISRHLDLFEQEFLDFYT